MAMPDTTRPDGEDDNHSPSGTERDSDPFAEESARGSFAQDGPAGELDLGDDDTRLPWLEGADDEEYDDRGGTGPILAFALLGLLLLGLIVGGIWWLTHRGADDELVADSSTITAPDTPYKQRPEDPGGLVAKGTGDASYRVSEGKDQTPRLGSAQPVPQPGFDTVNGGAAPAANSTPAATAKTGQSGEPTGAEAVNAAAPNAVGVQIGAYSSREKAEAGWSTLSRQYDELSGRNYRVVEGTADMGTVFRLMALAPDRGQAAALCSRLKTSGLNCYVRP